ncbi:unnamed protein product [Caenorhabditis sp. 36 PRJEB53466]|nr:unnamed protein product [Caenorhabditis sp. 36 PRJEB53466]
MNTLLLIASFVVVVGASARFEATLVQATVTLRCKKPWATHAKVFLMEEDYNHNLLDEDDTMDFGTYEFTRVPEMKLSLRGEEFEMSGLEPYLFVSHACNAKKDQWKELIIPLFDTMYRSRRFDVVIDLDREESVIIPSLIYP